MCNFKFLLRKLILLSLLLGVQQRPQTLWTEPRPYSSGMWGHTMVAPPPWNHPPKIYRHRRIHRTNSSLSGMGIEPHPRRRHAEAQVIQASHYELEYILGRKIIFICTARGNPRPRITWYKDGVELYAHNYFQVHEWEIGQHKLKSKMEIDPATPMDVGYYECQANNKFAVDHRGFRTKYGRQ
ncbi:immunoglobulin domain-containing protein oig-4-like [Oratosquilla oratoria]|uniref:immunoglobulin domain-containing protein oig-4-like n=1 Tax=Oratosquilla oratoria TaxID=337810 RepID=UPI003F765117